MCSTQILPCSCNLVHCLQHEFRRVLFAAFVHPFVGPNQCPPCIVFIVVSLPCVEVVRMIQWPSSWSPDKPMLRFVLLCHTAASTSSCDCSWGNWRRRTKPTVAMRFSYKATLQWVLCCHTAASSGCYCVCYKFEERDLPRLINCGHWSLKQQPHTF
jgi:hypothetical protein